jgi:hypothetical protein
MTNASDATAPKLAAATVLRNVLLEAFMLSSMRRKSPAFNTEGIELFSSCAIKILHLTKSKFGKSEQPREAGRS